MTKHFKVGFRNNPNKKALLEAEAKNSLLLELNHIINDVTKPQDLRDAAQFLMDKSSVISAADIIKALEKVKLSKEPDTKIIVDGEVK